MAFEIEQLTAFTSLRVNWVYPAVMVLCSDLGKVYKQETDMDSWSFIHSFYYHKLDFF